MKPGIITAGLLAVVACTMAATLETRGENQPPDLRRGLVAFWSADGHAKDSVGANHGDAGAGVGYTADRNGTVGGAFLFNGRSGFVSVPDSADLDADDAFTLNVWIHPTAYADESGDYPLIVSKWYSSARHGDYILSLTLDGHVCLRVSHSEMGFVAARATSESVVRLGTWTCVTATFDRGTLRLYINGVLEAEKTSAAVRNAHRGEYVHDDVTIGGLWNDRFTFAGAIDDVAIWNRALVVTEVKRLCRQGVTVAPPAPSAEAWPFDAEEAKRRQQAAAVTLDVMVKTSVDLGDGVKMDFVLIPAGEFVMGSPLTEENRAPREGPRHPVRISRPFYLGVTEVTQAQWVKVTGKQPYTVKGPNRPIEVVSWDEAMDFCRRLTERERAAGRLSDQEEYRLPTEAEWEYACRAGTATIYHFSDDRNRLGDYAWFAQTNTCPVAQKKPNAWGLYDMHGNVWEWVLDAYDDAPYTPGLQIDPLGALSGEKRLFRGGSWCNDWWHLRSAYRGRRLASYRCHVVGFRCARAPVVPRRTLINSIGMELVRIPAGEFLMGSPPNEPGHTEREQPQHPVSITKAFYMSATEVTQAQYVRLMDTNPSRFSGPNLPVDTVSWDDAVAFCTALTRMEREKRCLAANETYRLPTEAEWEYACRAGAATAYAFGEGAGQLPHYAVYAANASRQPHPVGTKRPNAWGLHDTHGNVWEWCLDWYGPYKPNLQTDPGGPATGQWRVQRGGSWLNQAEYLRCAMRDRHRPTDGQNTFGFRIVRAAEGW